VNLRTSGRFRAPTTDLGQKFAQHVQRPREGVEFFRDRVTETAAVDAISARIPLAVIEIARRPGRIR